MRIHAHNGSKPKVIQIPVLIQRLSFNINILQPLVDHDAVKNHDLLLWVSGHYTQQTFRPLTLRNVQTSNSVSYFACFGWPSTLFGVTPDEKFVPVPNIDDEAVCVMSRPSLSN